MRGQGASVGAAAGREQDAFKRYLMPINIKLEDDGIYAPVITCDHCGKQIEDATWGNFSYQVHSSGQLVDGRIYYTHKPCTRTFESVMEACGKHLPSMRWFWDEMRRFPMFLMTNLKISEEHLEREGFLK